MRVPLRASEELPLTKAELADRVFGYINRRQTKVSIHRRNNCSESADWRQLLADRFLAGRGIEIGALHQPLSVPSVAHVTYVDRLTEPELRAHYPELPALVPVDIVDDGERLAAFADGSQDFVIANHVLEHCEDPIGALETFVRVLRPGGILYLAVPDKRRTFDVERPVTPFEHLLLDHREGPEVSRVGHYLEWSRLINHSPEPEAEAVHIMAIGYSIHFHVWTQREILELLVRTELPAAIEAVVQNGIEVLVLLRKT